MFARETFSSPVPSKGTALLVFDQMSPLDVVWNDESLHDLVWQDALLQHKAHFGKCVNKAKVDLLTNRLTPHGNDNFLTEFEKDAVQQDVVWDEEQQHMFYHPGLLKQIAQGGTYVVGEYDATMTEYVQFMDPVTSKGASNMMLDGMENMSVVWDDELLHRLDCQDALVQEEVLFDECLNVDNTASIDLLTLLTKGNETFLKEVDMDPTHNLFSSVQHEVVWDEKMPADIGTHESVVLHSGLLQQLAFGSKSANDTTGLPNQSDINTQEGILEQLDLGEGYMDDKRTKQMVELSGNDEVDQVPNATLAVVSDVYSCAHAIELYTHAIPTNDSSLPLFLELDESSAVSMSEGVLNKDIDKDISVGLYQLYQPSTKGALLEGSRIPLSPINKWSDSCGDLDSVELHMTRAQVCHVEASSTDEGNLKYELDAAMSTQQLPAWSHGIFIPVESEQKLELYRMSDIQWDPGLCAQEYKCRADEDFDVHHIAIRPLEKALMLQIHQHLSAIGTERPIVLKEIRLSLAPYVLCCPMVLKIKAFGCHTLQESYKFKQDGTGHGEDILEASCLNAFLTGLMCICILWSNANGAAFMILGDTDFGVPVIDNLYATKRCFSLLINGTICMSLFHLVEDRYSLLVTLSIIHPWDPGTCDVAAWTQATICGGGNECLLTQLAKVGAAHENISEDTMAVEEKSIAIKLDVVLWPGILADYVLISEGLNGTSFGDINELQSKIDPLVRMQWDPGIDTATAWGQAVFRGGGNVTTQVWPSPAQVYQAQLLSTAQVQAKATSPIEGSASCWRGASKKIFHRSTNERGRCSSTSSKRWCGLWKRCPVIDFSGWPNFESAGDVRQYIAIVNNVLEQRSGAASEARIDELKIPLFFSLCLGRELLWTKEAAMIAAEVWILYAMHHQVKAFHFDLRLWPFYADGACPVVDLDELLPSSPKLECLHLGLGYTEIRLPRTAVFRSLKDLTLEFVKLATGSVHLLARLLSSVCCPSLQKLCMSSVQFNEAGTSELVLEASELLELSIKCAYGYEMEVLELRTPKLLYLEINNCLHIKALRISAPALKEVTYFSNIAFIQGRLPCVQRLKIDLNIYEGDDDQENQNRSSIYLMKLCTSSIRCLLVHLYIPDIPDIPMELEEDRPINLIKDNIPPLPKVTSLMVSRSFTRQRHSLGDGVASLLTSFKNLEYLSLVLEDSPYIGLKEDEYYSKDDAEAFSCDHPDHWNGSDIYLAKLRDANFRGMTGTGCEIRFLQFVLASATDLQSVTISFNLCFTKEEVQDSRMHYFLHSLLGDGIWTTCEDEDFDNKPKCSKLYKWAPSP